MPSAAGFQLVAGRIPGERIATDTVTSNSSAITTTETVVQSVTAALVTGRTYRIRYAGAILASAATTNCRVRIREDDDTGTIQQTRIHTTGPDAADSAPVMGETEFTATATGDKTFVVTIQRETGAGNFTWQAAANNAAYLYVDYISG